jgi:hypothetical protein
MMRRWLQYAKNLPGWRSKEKYLLLSCDDFGAVRLADVTAREYLVGKGLPMDLFPFDRYDTLESVEDLQALRETLLSVKDIQGRGAVMTGFGLAANIDFARMRKEGFAEFRNEPVSRTFERLGKRDAWDLMQQMRMDGDLVMEFHGREHVHVGWLMRRLREKNPQLLACMEVDSLAGLEYGKTEGVDYTASFAYDTEEEIPVLASILWDGLQLFEQEWGDKPRHFTPPVMRYPRALDAVLLEAGVAYLDRSMQTEEWDATANKFRKHWYFLNQRLKSDRKIPAEWGMPAGGSASTLKDNIEYTEADVVSRIAGYAINEKIEPTLVHSSAKHLRAMVRNCFFEPMFNPDMDWVDHTMAQISAAFAVGKPANIAMHRMSFVGGISPAVRERGNRDLKEILRRVKQQWPEVRFVSTRELGGIMNS